MGIICQSCNVCLPNFNVFGNLGTNMITEISKGSLIAPDFITSKCVTGALWQSFQHSYVILPGRVDFADRQWHLAKWRDKSLKHISPRIGYHNKERLRLTYTYAQYDRELLEPDKDISTICKSTLLTWKQWPSTEVGTHGPQPENWYDFFRFVLRSVSLTKVKFF